MDPTNYIPANDSRGWFFVPAAIATATSLTSRALAGGIGLTAKIAGKFAGMCSENAGESLNATGNKYLSYATRNPKAEAANILFWTALGGIAYEGVSVSNDPSTMEKLQRNFGIVPPSYPWEAATSYLSENRMLNLIPTAISLGVSLFSGSTNTNEVAQVVEVTQETEKSVVQEEADTTSQEKIKPRIYIDRSEGTYFGEQYSYGENGKVEGWVAHGEGMFVTFNKTKYEGLFEYDEFKSGTITYPNGEVENFSASAATEQTLEVKTTEDKTVELENDALDENEIDPTTKETATYFQEETENLENMCFDSSKGIFMGSKMKDESDPNNWFANGQGIFTTPDKTMYEGAFVKGTFIMGVITDRNGQKSLY
jgi:hypothetical protein